MSDMKLYNGINNIDDDLIEEAAVPVHTVSETDTEDTNAGFTASGVEMYNRSGWRRFSAVAAALLLTAGLAGGGVFYLKNRRTVINDSSVTESEFIAPVTNNGDIVTTDSKETSEVKTTSAKSDKKQSKTTETTASADKHDVTATYPVSGIKNESAETTVTAKGSGTNKTASSPKSTAKTTAKTTANNAKTTTTTTAPNIAYTRPTVEVPSDGRMTVDEIIQFVKYYGGTMTWSDFEPYEHEDVGSGQWVWIIPVYKDGEQKFTLSVSGLIEKIPNRITLYRGTNAGQGDFIDLRQKSDDVFDFIYPELAFKNVLGTLIDCHPDFIRDVEITSPDLNHEAYLGYSETERMLELLRNVEIISDDGSAWQASNNMYYQIVITDNQWLTHVFTVQYPYLIIDDVGYKATDSSISALSEYCREMCTSRQPAQQVDVNGVWCWYDWTAYSGDPRDKTDCITIKQFPDLIFDFHGKNHTIAVYDTNINKLGEVGAQFNAYFADINGDGYPELCSTYDWGLNRAIISEVKVWDIHNNKNYSLVSPDEYNYYLYEENGELFVNKQSVNSAWDITSRHGEKGRLKIDGDSLVFVPVE